MIKPIYRQDEADLLIAMEKRAAYEGQAYVITSRVTHGYAVDEFAAIPNEDIGRISFKIIAQSNFDVDAYSLTLSGSIGDRPRLGNAVGAVQDG